MLAVVVAQLNARTFLATIVTLILQPCYREALGNLVPADVCFGRDQAVIESRKRIKEMIIRNLRLHHNSQGA